MDGWTLFYISGSKTVVGVPLAVHGLAIVLLGDGIPKGPGQLLNC